MEPDRLKEEAARYLVGGAVSLFRLPDEYGFYPERGEGPYIYDLSGRRYIDYVLGSGPLILGHRPTPVIEAVIEQLGRGTTFYYTNEQAVELARLIVEASPCAERVVFTASGTEAIMLAVRLARAYTGREKILKFEGSYHGWYDQSVLSSSIARVENLPSYPEPSIDSAGIPRRVAETILVAPYNSAEDAEGIARRYRDELAGILLEPYQRGIPTNPHFLKTLREIASELAIPLIFDEVVTGFRLRYGGAQEYYGVVPDIACYGKIIGGGFPIGAVAGKRDVMSLADPALEGGKRVFRAGTMSGNPVSCIAGTATLKELRRPGVYDSLEYYGRRLAEGMSEVFERHKIDAQITQAGPMVDYFFTKREIVDYRSAATSDRELKRRLAYVLLRRGVMTNPATRLYISTAHGELELRQTLDSFEEATAEIVRAKV